jgi:hypothetical protein
LDAATSFEMIIHPAEVVIVTGIHMYSNTTANPCDLGTNAAYRLSISSWHAAMDELIGEGLVAEFQVPSKSHRKPDDGYRRV